MSEKDILYKVGQYCRWYRVEVLENTLKEIENDDYIKALSSFEHGRSSNLLHLLKYVNKCETKEDKLQFFMGLIDILEGE